MRGSLSVCVCAKCIANRVSNEYENMPCMLHISMLDIRPSLTLPYPSSCSSYNTSLHGPQAKHSKCQYSFWPKYTRRQQVGMQTVSVLNESLMTYLGNGSS